MRSVGSTDRQTGLAPPGATAVAGMEPVTSGPGSTLVQFGPLPADICLLHSRQRPGFTAVGSRAVDRTDDTLLREVEFCVEGARFGVAIRTLSEALLMERIVA